MKRRVLGSGVLAAVLSAGLFVVTGHGPGAEASAADRLQVRCQQYAASRTVLAGHPLPADPTGPAGPAPPAVLTSPTGSGQASVRRILVVGDSWSAGWLLAHPERGWPSRLEGVGEVSVDGFPGSGFSARASDCGGTVAFAARTRAALRAAATTDHLPDVLVVQGGLNDFDRPEAEVARGFDGVLAAARAYDLRPIVIGPATAPRRHRGAERVDRMLRRLAAAAGVAYVPTGDLRLAYLPDRLHLTAAGHRDYGDALAERLAVRLARTPGVEHLTSPAVAGGAPRR